MTVLEKHPSKDLISLLNVAASGMLAFGELWDTVKKKGAEEGFDEKALLVLFAPMVKDKFTAAQVRYLMNKEKEQERARDNRQKQKEELKTLRTYAHIPPKKELEQSDHDWHYEQGEKEEERMEKIEEQKKAEQEPEEPTELELANIKIAQLEDALHKVSDKQFVTATDIQEPQKEFNIDEAFKKLPDDDAMTCWKINSISGTALKNRILSWQGNSLKFFRVWMQEVKAP